MKTQAREDPRIVAAAERQMQAWARTTEIADRAIRAHLVRPPAVNLRNYLTISRETGTGASEIATIIGRELGWEVLDKTLLDRVAEKYGVSRQMLDLVDETRSNWVYDVLGTWIDRHLVPHEKYIACLSRVILASARQGEVIVVGRGAQFLLPRDMNLSVRLVASQKYRLQEVMRHENLDEARAQRYIEETDAGRHEFVHRFFHHDVSDPHLYDLVINIERVGQAGAVDLILRAMGR